MGNPIDKYAAEELFGIQSAAIAIADKNKKIVLYCTIGNRSGRYAKKLRQQKIESYNLVGGILAWAWDEGQLIDSQGLTKRVHVYGARWNLLPNSYEAVY